VVHGKDISSGNMHMKNLKEALICIVHTIIYIYIQSDLSTKWH